MAWFKRNRDEIAASSDDAGSVAPEPAPEPAADAPPAAAAAPSTPSAPAWMSAAPMPHVIPVIQRVLAGDARASTTLGKPSPLSLAPLGHAVTPDAPTGVVTALAVPDGDHHLPHDEPPLQYVQRAPLGSTPARPSAPAQLLVPSFQPSRLPSLPTATAEVQRAPTSPSFTTAPAPEPPLVLRVGEILSTPPAAPPDAALASISPLAAPAPATEPGPVATSPPAVPAADLPLAPVQRHADHPGQVGADAAPAIGAQRAPLDAPAPPAPAGLPAAAGVELPLAALPRSADHPGRVDGDDTPDTAQRAPIEAPAPAATAPDAPLVSANPLTAAKPAAVAPLATGAPATPEVDLPLAPAQRSADHPDHPGRVEDDDAPEVAPTAAAPAAPVTSAPLVGDAPPLTAPPDSPQPAGPEAPAGPAAPTMSLPSAAVQRRATGRRLGGLGRPIGAVPPDAIEPGTVQRAPAPPGAPLTGAEPLQPPPAMPLAAVQRAAADDAETGAELAAAATPETEEGPSLDLVQRPPVDAGASSLTSAATTASSSSSGTTPAAATAPLPPLVMAPLLGGRPFSIHVQRAPDSGVTTPLGLIDRTSPEALSPEPGRVYQPLAGIGMWNGAPPPDLPGPAIEAAPSHVTAAVQRALGTDVSNVRIRRDTGPTAQRLAARAFTHDGEVHIPASVGSLESGEGASLAAHELVHAGQQSVLGSSRPHQHTPQGQALEAHARSTEHASLAGLELPKLPLAPAPAPAVQRAPADGTSSSPFSPQQLSTLLSLADNPPSGASVQRESIVAEAPPRPSSAAPDGPPPSPSTPAPGGQTPQELEELATKLFPTLRNLFRSELLGFRRRSGTSSDRPLS